MKIKFYILTISTVLVTVLLCPNVFAQTNNQLFTSDISNSGLQATDSGSGMNLGNPTQYLNNDKLPSNSGSLPANKSANSGSLPVNTKGNSGDIPSKSSNVSGLTNPLKGINSVGQVVGKFAEIFSYVVILFAVLALVWTGLQFITAQGKADKITELRNRMLWIVVGIAIVIGARIIVGIVINTLQATGTVNPDVIQQANNALNNK
jgi:hypothetical protein